MGYRFADGSDAVALIARPDGHPALVPQRRPTPGPSEALLRVVCVGLCRTDLLVASGVIQAPPGLVLGHEFCGVVEEARGAGAPMIGTVVAVDPTFPRPDGSDGFMGRDTDGCLATWAVVPFGRLRQVPSGMTAMEAAYLEPVAAAMGGVPIAAAAARGGGAGALVGANRIAALTALLLRGAGVRFDHLSHAEFAAAVRGGGCWEWLLECGLTDDLLVLAAEALRPRGTLIMKSRHRMTMPFPAMRWAEKELALVGRSRAGFREAMAWLSANRAAVRPMFGEVHHLADWETAFAAAKNGDEVKTFVVPPGAEAVFAALGDTPLRLAA